MSYLSDNDPDFAEIFSRLKEQTDIKEESRISDTKTRYTAVLSSLLGCGAKEAFAEELKEALEKGFSPLAVKEIVYQSAAYLGYGKMLPFLRVCNDVFGECAVSLPTESQRSVSDEERLKSGVAAQTEIFGEQMKEAYKAGDINLLLACNCFGDYYTRKGLTLAERELVTFCLLTAHGGCEMQLTAHVKGNINMGNDKEFLRKAVLCCLPYIGYPRSLNALSCIEKA